MVQTKPAEHRQMQSLVLRDEQNIPIGPYGRNEDFALVASNVAAATDGQH